MPNTCLARCSSLPAIQAALVILASQVNFAIGADQVMVRIDDGRVLTGDVDSRTEDRFLWMRMTDGGVSVSTAVSWDSVSSAEYAGKQISSANLKNLSSKLKSDLPDEFFTKPIARPSVAEAVLSDPTVIHRVHAIDVEARLATWDADVEPDGFEVRILPAGSDRRIVAVDGSVSMRLMGRTIDRRTGRVTFGDFQRYSARVQVEEFGQWGVVCRFPFQTIRPEFDLELSADALLNVRLGVSGSGNFEATVPVRIRHYDRVRDELQLHEGTRFFRNEWTERTRY